MRRLTRLNILGTTVCLLLTACGTSLFATPAPTQTPTPAPTPTLPYTERVQEIQANWQQIDSLARTHMASAEAAMMCETCHAEGIDLEEDPKNAVCIDCHGGSIEAVRTMTDEDGEEIHPFGHLTNTQCSSCHRPHRTLDDPCAQCH